LLSLRLLGPSLLIFSQEQLSGIVSNIAFATWTLILNVFARASCLLTSA